MTDYKYKVTVGMPVYGVENYIQKSLLSVLNQTYKDDFEILVVDDLGPDNSMSIVEELQNSHPRGNSIRILTQPKNMGCWAARNRILEEAQGEYLLLLDSDDYLSEDAIEKLDSLIGLESVKKEVSSLVNLIKVREIREKRGTK